MLPAPALRSRQAWGTPMAVITPSRLPPQKRPHVLAGLEAEIARTRELRDRWTARVRATRKAGRDPRWAEGMAGLADERLAQLERSVEVLTRGEEGYAADLP